jgi:hypothetical protein
MTIATLRKKYPKSKMGYREKDILFGKGARLSKPRDFSGCYKVTRGNSYFVFTYGRKDYKDFTVIL